MFCPKARLWPEALWTRWTDGGLPLPSIRGRWCAKNEVYNLTWTSNYYCPHQKSNQRSLDYKAASVTHRGHYKNRYDVLKRCKIENAEMYAFRWYSGQRLFEHCLSSIEKQKRNLFALEILHIKKKECVHCAHEQMRKTCRSEIAHSSFKERQLSGVI